MPAASAEITGLLKAWGAGDRTALDSLIPVVYAQIHQLAHRYVDDAHWSDRAHFFAVSAQSMRRILVDAARTRAAQKRGG